MYVRVARRQGVVLPWSRVQIAVGCNEEWTTWGSDLRDVCTSQRDAGKTRLPSNHWRPTRITHVQPGAQLHDIHAWPAVFELGVGGVVTIKSFLWLTFQKLTIHLSHHRLHSVSTATFTSDIFRLFGFRPLFLAASLSASGERKRLMWRNVCLDHLSVCPSVGWSVCLSAKCIAQNGWVDPDIDRWMDERMDGWMDRSIDMRVLRVECVCWGDSSSGTAVHWRWNTSQRLERVLELLHGPFKAQVKTHPSLSRVQSCLRHWYSHRPTRSTHSQGPSTILTASTSVASMIYLSFWQLKISHLKRLYQLSFSIIFTSAPAAARSIVMSIGLCLSLCRSVCLSVCPLA